MKPHYVVDTNVPVVANRKSDQADNDCVLASIEALEQVRNGKIILDTGNRIIQQYMNNLSLSGQPGVGDFFMKWVFNNQANEDYCQSVDVEPQNDNDELDGFPDDPDLIHFDRDDRVFVAVAIKNRKNPQILNSTDSDWSQHHAALVRHGLKITFLCPQCTCPDCPKPIRTSSRHRKKKQ